MFGEKLSRFSFHFFIFQILLHKMFAFSIRFIFIFQIFFYPAIYNFPRIRIIDSLCCSEKFSIYTQQTLNASEILLSSFSLKTNILHPVLSDRNFLLQTKNVSRRRDAIGDAPFIYF